MIFKRFYVIVIVQVILFAITVYLLMWTVNQPHMVVTSINLGIISVLQIVYLLYYIASTNRDLAKFFEAFQFHDPTLSFQQKKGKKAFLPLYQNFDRILEEYRKLRNANEKDRLFFLNILNHFNIGVLVSDKIGRVHFSNKAIRRYRKGKEINHLDQLENLRPGLVNLLLKMKPDQRELLQVVDSNELTMLSVRCSEYKLDGEILKIISFQDINYEIEQREIDAWQKLIRILTHEIMNSVSPITLTSSGIINLLERDGQPRDADEIDDSLIDNALLGLHAIRKRSKGLAKFVESYRSITQIPKPSFSHFKIKDLFQDIESLMIDELRRHKITFSLVVRQANLQVFADEKLIGQVLINLVNNAAQALFDTENPQIKLEAWQHELSVFISVTDNGKGISVENLENIFVPFFTTKVEGSGIGLSLSRQIMRLHSGNISVQSLPGVETVFKLKF